MKTAVLTDTNSGITVEEGKKLGIYVLPMPVIIQDHCYLEGLHSIYYKNIKSRARICAGVCTYPGSF